MYPRNAASPPPIAIGPVVQISDGAVQTSGCTVRIIPVGVAEGDGGGTTSYSTDGIVYYTPTQAETNYTAFILIAKKTGCIPANVTVVTTASSTAGKVDVSHVGGTAQTARDLGADTAAIVADTNELQTDLANGGRLDLLIDAILEDTGTTLPGILTTISGYVDCLPVTWVIPAAAGDAMALTSGERTTLAAAIEAAIINELDGQAVMQAIADLIASDMTTTDLTVAAIAAAVRDAVLNRILAGNHDTGGTPGALLQMLGNATYGLAAVKTLIDDVPTVTEFEARTLAAADYFVVGDYVAPLTAQETVNALKLAPAAGDPAAGSPCAELDTIVAATAALSGSGAYAVTITVTDDATPAVALSGATVRLTATGGALAYVATTNGSGVATFSLDDDTYTITLTKAGYSYTSSTIVVSGAAAAATKIMTTVAIPSAPAATQLTAYGTCRTADGTAENGVTVTFTLQAPSGEGQYNRTALTAVSGATGAYTLTLAKNAIYTMSRANGASKAKTILTPTTSTYQLPTI